MSNLNFVRQFMSEAEANIPIAKAFCAGMSKDDREYFRFRDYIAAYGLCKFAEKFQLPDGGIIFEDFELKALNDNEELKMPFDQIALEFPLDGRKFILLATVVPNVREIVIVAVANPNDLPGSRWGSVFQFSIPNKLYVDRSSLRTLGRCQFFIKPGHNFSEDEINAACFFSEIFLGFLNALQCSNVRIERQPARKPAKKGKNPLPFDAYHVLTVDLQRNVQRGESKGGSHRSPREHLRRGHIRVYQSGMKVWVNAAVVCADSNRGKVTKDYRLIAGTGAAP